MLIEKRHSDWLIEGVSLSRLAMEWKTPFYVYSKRTIVENIHRLQSVMSRYFDRYRIQYPIKANSNPHILKIMVENGLFADCSSPGEVFLAKKAGFDLSRSTYTGNFESQDDLCFAVKHGLIINLDDFARLDDLLQYGRPDVLSFRINPGIGRGGFEGIVTGGTDAKFGFPYEQVRTAYEEALKKGFTRFGVHMMTGSNILEPFYFAEITQKLTMIIGEVIQDLGIQLEFINIGGGLGIPYSEEEPELDLDITFRHVAESYQENCAKYQMGNPVLVIEPGRYLVGNAGILVSTVHHVKKSYRNYVGIDAGMNVLIRPALYKAYHRVEIFSQKNRSTGPIKAYITGQVCENSDIYPIERTFPSVHPGDLAIIYDTGAYGFVMSSQYNNRPRPAEFLVDGDSCKVIRYPETLDDLVRNVPDLE